MAQSRELTKARTDLARSYRTRSPKLIKQTRMEWAAKKAASLMAEAERIMAEARDMADE